MKSIDLSKLKEYTPPQSLLKITTLDAHTEGEPLRIITSGLPNLNGNTILEMRRDLIENNDYIRTALMWEPRGHADMYGCIVTSPTTPDADFGVIFLHNEGYSTMCGHGIIAVTKAVIETGLIKTVRPTTSIKINTPAGIITSTAEINDGNIASVSFINVPSFVLMKNKSVNTPGIGKVKFDIAYGGAFYAYVNADELGIKMTPENVNELIEKGMEIKNAVINNYEIKHPYEDDLSFLYGTIFMGKPLTEKADSRNVCIFAEGEVDRSPTGTGVSGRMALHFSNDEIKINEPLVIESILGTSFTVKIKELTKFGIYDALIPEVTGNAYITGKHEFLIDPNDPLKNGFIIR
jgi:trans-L-3-hydroxyproline dehydratase